MGLDPLYLSSDALSYSLAPFRADLVPRVVVPSAVRAFVGDLLLGLVSLEALLGVVRTAANPAARRAAALRLPVAEGVALVAP